MMKPHYPLSGSNNYQYIAKLVFILDYQTCFIYTYPPLTDFFFNFIAKIRYNFTYHKSQPLYVTVYFH